MSPSSLGSCRQLARPDIAFREFVPLLGPRGRGLEDRAQVPLHILCDKCKGLKEQLQESLEIPKDRNPPGGRNLKHYESLGLLRDSFNHGCHLCTILLGSLSKDLSQSIIEESHGMTKQSYIIKARFGTFYFRGIYKKTLMLRLRLRGASTSTVHISSSEPNTHSLFTTTVSTVSTKDATVRSFYRKCLEICDKTHTKCRVKRVDRMPTRLLHITPNSGGTDDTPSVRLVLTGPEFSKDTEFAALSYCWGGRHGLQLEESNYQSLMEHIPFDKLPATIQDSIRVTIELGLQYLWVDALCIIQNQDSNKYWTEEAGKMCDIYQGCSIAIAASGASNSTEGLFAARDPLQQAECLIGTSLITLRLEPYRPQAGDWALDTRGWALQEEILPARSIRFGSYVSWTCRELSVNEFGQIENEREEGNLPRDFFTRILEPQPANPVNEGETYELWRRIMYRYTSTKLSERSDRLVAIEGLRSAFEKRTGWACAGGLWQSFIMRELLWCRIGAEPSGLRPSWSWASMDGTLRLCPKQTDGYKDIAKLVGVSPSSSGRVAFDSPRKLELSGVPCRTGETSSRLWLKMSLFGEGWPDNRLYATYDDKTRMWMEGDMGLPLRADGYSGLDGLIVVPGRGSGTYKRVGYFFTVPMSKASGARVVERLVKSLEDSNEEPSKHRNLQLV